MNTNAKHTPGPWYAELDCIQGPNNEYIATACESNPNWKADAKLCAAAPDLLWALHACLADLQDIVLAEGGDESPAMIQARAAIAQAEGGEA